MAHRREQGRVHYQANRQLYIEKAKKNKQATIQRNREFLKDYLSNHPCVDCGNSDNEVLQFDHLDRDTKTKEVSLMLDGSRKVLLDEIEKCVVRCANCHMKRTRRQMGWWHNSL